MCLLSWYIFEVLIGHFGEGKINKLHIAGNRRAICSVLRFLFDSKWMKVLIGSHQIVYLNLLKTLVKSGVGLIIGEFQGELQPFLEKQSAIRFRDAAKSNQPGQLFRPLFQEEESGPEDAEVSIIKENPEKASFSRLKALWKKIKRARTKTRRNSI